MQINERNEQWARKHLEELSYLPGSPKSDPQWKGVSRAFLRLVRNRTAEHPVLGRVNDVEWLIAQAGDACDRFPSARQMRAIYEQYFTPADGKTTADLTEALANE